MLSSRAHGLALAGVNWTTFYRWLRRGHQSLDSKFGRFLPQVNQALALAEHRQLAVIRKAARTDWQAAAWILARRFPEPWGRAQTLHDAKAAHTRLRFHVEK